VAHSTPDAGDVGRTGAAIQLGDTRVVGILRNLLFYQTAMREPFRYIDRKLEQWARRKYKTLSRHKRRSLDWLSRVKEDDPGLFAHWRAFENQVG